MTKIFDEHVTIDNINTDQLPIAVSLPSTTDLDDKQSFQEILIELRKINLYLSLMTGENIQESDL